MRSAVAARLRASACCAPFGGRLARVATGGLPPESLPAESTSSNSLAEPIPLGRDLQAMPSSADARASSANSTCSSSIVKGGASATPSRSHRVSNPASRARLQSLCATRLAEHELRVERDSGHQADAAADLADAIVAAQLAESLMEARLELECAAHEPVARPADRGSRSRLRSRPGARRRSYRGQTLAGLGRCPEGLRDVRGGDHATERQIAARHALCEHDQVRGEVESFDGEPGSEAAEAADHDVGDGQHAVVTADSLDLTEVAGRRYEDAARPDHRLEDERGDALGSQSIDSASSAAASSHWTWEVRSTSGPNSSLYGIPRMLVPMPWVP